VVVGRKLLDDEPPVTRRLHRVPALAPAARKLGEAKLRGAHVTGRDPVIGAQLGKVGVILVQQHRFAADHDVLYRRQP
jgi:hypothetical protein